MDKFIRNNNIISGQIQDETVMMDIGKGEYYQLNPVASRIWELLDNELSLDGICDILSTEYDVDDKQCHMQVEAHLQKLMEMGLVKKIS